MRYSSTQGTSRPAPKMVGEPHRKIDFEVVTCGADSIAVESGKSDDDIDSEGIEDSQMGDEEPSQVTMPCLLQVAFLDHMLLAGYSGCLHKR